MTVVVFGREREREPKITKYKAAGIYDTSETFSRQNLQTFELSFSAGVIRLLSRTSSA